MCFLDRGVQLVLLTTANALDEIGEMIVVRTAARTRLLVAAEPALVTEGIFVAGGEVSVRSVKNVADRVVAIEQTAADAGLVVRDPVPDLDFHHFAAPVRLIEFE